MSSTASKTYDMPDDDLWIFETLSKALGERLIHDRGDSSESKLALMQFWSCIRQAPNIVSGINITVSMLEEERDAGYYLIECTQERFNVEYYSEEIFQFGMRYFHDSHDYLGHMMCPLDEYEKELALAFRIADIAEHFRNDEKLSVENHSTGKPMDAYLLNMSLLLS